MFYIQPFRLWYGLISGVLVASMSQSNLILYVRVFCFVMSGSGYVVLRHLTGVAAIMQLHCVANTGISSAGKSVLP
jgi:hypothetical protein